MAYILLVDDEEDILAILELTLKTIYKEDVLSAASGKQAIEIIKKKGSPDLVISDYRMGDGDGVSVFKYLRSTHPAVPFIVCSGNPMDDLAPLFEGAEGFIEKPAIITPLIDMVRKLLRPSPGHLEFVPIWVNLLHSNKSLSFDLYLQLSDTNIVRMFKKGDSLFNEDIEKLEAKGITHLKLKHEDCLPFLKHHEQTLIDRIKIEADPEKIVSHSLNSLTIIPKLAKPLGWTPDFLDFAKNTISTAVTTLSKDIAIRRIITEKLSDPTTIYNKHVFLTALLGCTFCNYLGFTTEAAHMKMAMATVLHDIFVDEKCYEDLDAWNRYALSKNESAPDVVKYRNHPLEAANFVRSVKNLPPDIDQIILQHQERPDGSGFPRGLNAPNIAHLSSLFIMTEDFVHMLLKHSSVEKAFSEYLMYGADNYTSANFKKIFAVLRSKLQATSLNSST